MSGRTGRILLASCVVLAAVLLLADARGAVPTAALRSVASALTGPAVRGLAAVRNGVEERVSPSAQGDRVAELEEQLRQARADAAAAAARQLEEERARELVSGLPTTGYRRVGARLVALSWPQDPVRSASISAGSGSGVAVGQAVIGVGGLVGLVDSVGPGIATLRLLADPSTALTARVASSGEVGIVRGTGSALSFTPLDPMAAMAPGDLLVTLGTPDGALPADLPLGRITDVSGSAADLTRTAAVDPVVNESTLDHVLALVPGAGK